MRRTHVQVDLAGAEHYRLQSGILFYTSGQNQTIATRHEANILQADGESQVSLGPAQLLSRKALRAALVSLCDTPVKMVLFPETLLAYDGYTLIWWWPAQRRQIHFATKDTAFDSLFYDTTVQYPPLLFRAVPGHLFVWALAENTRPTLTSRVCVAPFYNLSTLGHMCPGNVVLPDNTEPHTIPQWESGLCDSQFSHTNRRGEPHCTHPEDHIGFWKAMRSASLEECVAWLSHDPGMDLHHVIDNTRPAAASENPPTPNPPQPPQDDH